MKVNTLMTNISNFFRKHDHEPLHSEREPITEAAIMLRESNGPKSSDEFSAEEEKRMLDAGWTLGGPDGDDSLIVATDISNYPADQFQKHFDAWSGVSVKDLEEINLQTICDQYPELFDSARLSRTVPKDYQGEVYEANRDHPNAMMAMSNSLASTRNSVAIVAIDEAGDALVKTCIFFAYEGVDAMNYKIMPKAEAFALIDNYRASHEIAKELFGEQELLPAEFDYSDYARSFVDVVAQYQKGEFSEYSAQPGSKYIGKIIAFTKETVCQDIGGNMRIIHDTKYLIGIDLSDRVGKEVEISYPHGAVGLAKEAENAYDATKQLHKTNHGDYSL